jgi:hypothetical protein
MATKKQKAAARHNIKKAKAAKRKRTIAHVPNKTRSALGKEAAKAAKRSRLKTRRFSYVVLLRMNLLRRSCRPFFHSGLEKRTVELCTILRTLFPTADTALVF